MEQDKELNEPFQVQINENTTPSVQPSTSEFQATETTKDGISGEKIEASRSAPGAGLRQRSANLNTNIAAVDVGEQNQMANMVENVPVKEDKNRKNNTITLLVNIPICDMPAQISPKKEEEKENDPHLQKPDYENCDYYAYDYETVEECAEDLAPDESIEITIDCTKQIPMFAEFIPIRHYSENTRVVRLVRRYLFVTTITPLPVELFSEEVTDQEKSDENNTDDIGIVIKMEPEEPKMEVFNDNENVAEYGENSENINIEREIEENNINERNVEYEFSNTDDLFKNVYQRLSQVKSNLQTLQKNISEFKESVEQMEDLSTLSRLLQGENINNSEH